MIVNVTWMISILKRALAMEIVQSLRTPVASWWTMMESKEGQDSSGSEVVVMLLQAELDRGVVLPMQVHQKLGGGEPRPDFHSFCVAT